MNFTIDLINALVILAALANMVYGLVVYSRNRNDATNFWFFVLTLAVSAWGVSMFLFRGFGEISAVVLSARILYVAAAAIPLSFLYFIFVFPNQKSELTERQKYLLPLPFLAISALSLWPGGLIEIVQFIPNAENIIVFNPIYHLLYALYIVGYFGAGYILLFRRFKTADGLYRRQILYIFSGTLIATLIGVATNLLLPLAGIFALNWFGQVGTVVMIGAISYAILKHHLFNVRVIATEVFVASFWIFAFIRFFLSVSPQDKLADSTMLFVSIILGIWLIRSVQKEVEHAEKEAAHARQVEKLAEELEEANNGQENLIHTLSHQVKGGLARAGGMFASILEGDYNDNTLRMTEMLKEALRLNKQDVANLEQTLMAFNPRLGAEAYDMEIFDFRDALMETVKNLKMEAESKNLALEVRADESEKYMLKGDRVKITSRVLNNLIENAILFTPAGNITVDLRKKEGKIFLSVTDTGTGITPENMRILFTRGGHGKDSIKVNVHSTGNGLYLAKIVVEKHGGKIWAESPGAGKGSTFFMELPTTMSG